MNIFIHFSHASSKNWSNINWFTIICEFSVFVLFSNYEFTKGTDDFWKDFKACIFHITKQASLQSFKGAAACFVKLEGTHVRVALKKNTSGSSWIAPEQGSSLESIRK